MKSLLYFVALLLSAVVILFVFLSLSGLTSFLIFEDGGGSEEVGAAGFNESCITSVEEKIVRGDSLSGVLEDGEGVIVFVGYYDCNVVERGDVILYSRSGRADPLIKVVRGVPGDFLELGKMGDGWNISINGEALKSSEGDLYRISDSRSKVLSLYSGEILADTYLILGNRATGTLDSTSYGLVHKNGIVGKVAER